MKLLEFERRWLLSVFDAILPPGGDARLPLGVRDLPVERFLDEFFAASPPLYVMGVRACLWLVVWTPPFAVRKLTWFPSLSRADRLAHLERLAAADLYVVREAPMALKAVASMCYFGVPEIQGAMGIEPTDATPPSWFGGAS